MKAIRRAAAVLGILPTLSLVHAQESADFFDITGISPSEVVDTLPSPQGPDDLNLPVYGFVDLPISAGHRSQLVDALRKAVSPEAGYKAKQPLIYLLEEDGRYEEAIAVIDQVPKPFASLLIRKIGLLWKAGRQAEIAPIAADLKHERYHESHWRALTLIDRIKGRPEKALEMLSALETAPFLSPAARRVLASQHLEIERKRGRTQECMANPPTRAIGIAWKIEAGDAEGAFRAFEAGDYKPTPDDLMMTPDLAERESFMARVRDLLADAALGDRDRGDLLGLISDQKTRLELWASMPTGQAQTASAVARIPASVEDARAARSLALPFYRKAQDDPNLQLLMVALSANSTRPKELDPEAEQYLTRIATAFLNSPSPGATDPAKAAINSLSDAISPESLDQLLLSSPAFTGLPPADQMRYLIAARLDKRVLDLIARCDFGVAAMDSSGRMILNYAENLANGKWAPTSALEGLIIRIPDIATGSSSKDKQATVSESLGWLQFLTVQVSEPERVSKEINRLISAVGSRDPSLPQVILNAATPRIWNYPGLTFERPPIPPRSAASSIPWSDIMGLFAPPDPAFNVLSSSFGSYPRRSAGKIGEYPQSILAQSPWRANIAAIPALAPVDPIILTRLRNALEHAPSRTIIFDLMAAADFIKIPDEAARTHAVQRIAAISKADPEDISIGVYLFVSRTSKGEPWEKQKALLPRPEDMGSSELRRLNDYRHQDLATSLQRGPRRLGEGPLANAFKPTVPQGTPPSTIPSKPGTPPELSPYDRLQFYIEAGKAKSPEALALARKVLLDFIASEKARPDPEQNIAISVLSGAGQFDLLLADVRSAMEADKKPEVDIQRAFRKLHLYKIVHSHGESAAYAKRILELDPADATAAADVLRAAIAEEDRPLALKCMAALRGRSLQHLMYAFGSELPIPDRSNDGANKISVLPLFRGAPAQELSAFLLGVPLPAAAEDGSTFPGGLQLLIEHTASNDPENLQKILEWTGISRISSPSLIFPIAVALKDAGRNSEAIDLLAGAYFSPQPGESVAKADAEPIRFPRIDDGIKTLPEPYGMNLPGLAKEQWLEPLAEKAESFPLVKSTEGNRFLIRLAAAPTIETWQRLAPEFFRDMPDASARNIRRRIASMLQDLPDTGGLQKTILKETGDPGTGPKSLPALASAMRLSMEEEPGKPITMMWRDAKEALRFDQPGQDKAHLIASMIQPMALLADDADWQDLLGFIPADPRIGSQWMELADWSQSTHAPGRRTMEVANIVLSGLPKEMNNPRHVNLLLKRLALDESIDRNAFAIFRPWVSTPLPGEYLSQEEYPAQRRLFELVSGDLSAIQPVLHTEAVGNGIQSIGWSLTGYKTGRDTSPIARRFPSIDGLFNIEILAGAFSDKMDPVMTIPSAKTSGRIDVAFPLDAKFVSLVARQADGNLIRWTEPRQLTKEETVGLAMTPATESASVRRLRDSGPFSTEEAIEFKSTPGISVKLATIPCSGGEGPEISGWSLNSEFNARLSFLCRDADGKELGVDKNNDISLGGSGISWERFQSRGKPEIAPETASIDLLLITEASSRQRQSTIVLSGLRVSVPPVPVVPAFLSEVGSIPFSVNLLAVDPINDRIAVFSHKYGEGIFDFGSRKFTKVADRREDENRGNADWLAIGGGKIVVRTAAEFRITSIPDGTVVTLPLTGNRRSDNASVCLSADGNFLAWPGPMAGIHLARLDPGGPKKRLLESPQIYGMAFRMESGRLEAYSGSNSGGIYILPLEDWENGALSTVKNEDGGGSLRSDVSSVYAKDARRNVTFSSTGNDGAVKFYPTSREIYLPAGHVGVKADGTPFYISATGHIYLVDAEKVEGYVPPN